MSTTSQTYLRISEAGRVWVEVELDSIYSPGQRAPTDQQHHQHHVWESSSEVNHL